MTWNCFCLALLDFAVWLEICKSDRTVVITVSNHLSLHKYQ
jgi:hypothetical protein